jgi:N-hydroxyarylamine O-acetyltransferase
MTYHVDVERYLRRIDYQGPLEPTADTLRALHEAHLLAVPFENLDIHLGRPIRLDEAAILEKIVARRRGGFCYELNGAFAALLRALGFPVTMLSAGVARAEGDFGPEFDHLLLLVQLDAPWLADVGFGDGFRAPLRLVEDVEQNEGARAFRLSRDGERWTMLQRDDATWQPRYTFTLQPRQHVDFAGMCRHHQTSPNSSFTQRRVCSLARPNGRITLGDTFLIRTEDGRRVEQPIAGEAAFRAALRELFGIELDAV